MEGDANPIGVNNNTANSDSLPDPLVAVRGLAFLHLEATSDHSSEDETSFDIDGDEPTFLAGNTLFILEEVDLDTENSKFVVCPMTPYRAESPLNIEDSNRNLNGGLGPHPSSSLHRFSCHTSNVDHHYCVWHGSKYCCRAPEPNWDVKGTIEKEVYEDCLSDLECSDVMTDYANGIWLNALLGNEVIFLLETDQDDETKVSQDCRNEYDLLHSGVTCVNEGSSNTLAMDDLASLCVSHSKAPAIDEKGDLSGDLSKSLETEMVITVGHQQDNTSSPKRKEKCKLPCASAAIQDDQAGIEVENSQGEDRSASIRHSSSNPFMELYLANGFGNAMTSLITMTDESEQNPILCECFEEKEQEGETMILEEDMIDKECPGINTETEVHHLSDEDIQDQFTMESIKFHDRGQSRIQEEQNVEAAECSDIALEHVDIKCLCTIESKGDHAEENSQSKEDDHTHEDDHTEEDDITELIYFLKSNIQPTEHTAAIIEDTEQDKGEDIQEVEDNQKCAIESEYQDRSHVNEIIGNESEILDHGLEMVHSELQTVDDEPNILESVSLLGGITLQAVDSDVDFCSISSHGTYDTNTFENMADILDVCNQEHGHETFNVNNQGDKSTKLDCQTREGSAIKTDDPVDQPPRENTESNSKSMDTCAMKPDKIVDQPLRQNTESDSQSMENYALKTGDLVNQSPRENIESDSQSMDNCVIKIDNLVDQPQGHNTESEHQSMDDSALKIDDLVDQPQGNDSESEHQSMDNWAIKINDLVGQPQQGNTKLEHQFMDIYAVRIDDLVDQPQGDHTESEHQSMDNCLIKVSDLVYQPQGENTESEHQFMDNCAIKVSDLVGQPLQGNTKSEHQFMDIYAIRIDDLVDRPQGCNTESEHQSMDNCVIKVSDLVYQPQGGNTESEHQSMDNCAIKIVDLVDQPPEENNTMDIPKISDVLNDMNICLEPTEGSRILMVDNRPSTDNNLRTNSAQNISGKQMKRNASVHQEVEMHSKKKALETFPFKSLCAPITKGHHKIINNVVVENYQGGIAERHRSCFGENGEMLSLVKPIDGMRYNPTEIEKAHSLHVKDNIPNSQEPSQVCRDPDTIRGAELVRAQSIDLDQDRGASCSLYFMGSPSLCVKGTDSKMVKKKFKSAGKEATKKTENEAQALDVNEGFQPEEEKRLKRQSSIDKDSKKAPKILHGIHAEMFPDLSGNLKLFCHFGEIHADSSITWTKDSKLLARMHRGPKDDSPVSLAIVQTSKKDQGVYLCTLKNIHGKVTTEFHLTSEVLEQLTRYQNSEGGEEIEFNQLFFREDFITDMYFGGNLHGRIATDDLHFGEGVHRKAFRSKVMCGLLPVFNPGHLCVLKVHNAIAYGTKTNDELVQKNYKLAVQECYVQNTAREYAKLYAAEAEQLEEFGTVPEIIPIFLIHRPANNIPYATVEEELIGDFVKYSIKDGKEINVLRKDSEAGEKCCTFQHWVFERTNGNLLVTDMQGVGMKLTDVGIATMGKGYKGFKGNCSVSFIDQFKALHQCNKFCEILGLQSVRPANPKQKKTAPAKEKAQPIPTTSRKCRNSTKPKNKT